MLTTTKANTIDRLRRWGNFEMRRRARVIQIECSNFENARGNRQKRLELVSHLLINWKIPWKERIVVED